MTFKEFVETTPVEEVNNFWNSIYEVPQTAIDRNWKYSFKRDGKLVPVKWFIKELAKSKNTEVDFSSDDNNRDLFSEKFGFEIHEDLKFDQQDLKHFRKFYETYVQDKSLFQFFVNHSFNVLKECNIDPYRVRMAITQSNEAMIIVGMRAVLSYKNDRMGFIVTNSDLPEIQELYNVEKDYEFKGGDEVSFIYSHPKFIPDISVHRLLEINQETIKSEYQKIQNQKISRWNAGANTTSQTLHKILFEGDNVEQFLNFQSDMQMIDIAGRKIYKISMGSFLKNSDYSNIKPIEMFEKNNLIVMHEDTGLNQGYVFTHEVKIGDFVYLTYGQPRLSFLARIISEYSQITDEMDIDLDKGWVCRKVEILKEPKINNTTDLKEKYAWLPSGNTTFWEIKDINLANQLLFTKYYNVKIIDSSKKMDPQEEKENSMENKELPISPLNQILFGAPGTGKTFSTKKLSVEIIDGKQYGDTNDERAEIIRKYEEYTKKQLIKFTTFHQSLSYEDFIEGIKPIMSDEESSSSKIDYKIVSGIFKNACAVASYYCYREQPKEKTIEKQYDFDELYDSFLDYNRNLSEPKVYYSITGKPMEIFDINKNDSIRAKAQGSTASHVAPLTKENLQKLYDEFGSPDDIKSLQQVKNTVGVSPRLTEFYAIFKGLKEYENMIFQPTDKDEAEKTEVTFSQEEIIKKFEAGVFKNAVKNTVEQGVTPVVLICDEINRGNVSSIFGELITLLEDDKRMGKSEAIEVTLPYSKSEFSVPHNLYIIGTMNTADRSVEALDTALRRRFSFTEMKSDPQVLENYHSTGGQIEGGIDLIELLTTINRRIEILIDKDHQIGHSYFINVNDLSQLQHTFKNKIIPLLEEYFYGDFGKIGLVLGDSFVEYTEPKQNKEILFKFKGYDDVEFLTDKKIFFVKDMSEVSASDFISIYRGSLLNSNES